MSILHIQRTSAFESNDFTQCVATILSDDALVFIDDGCYNINHPLFINLKEQNKRVKILHVQEHAQARGIEPLASQSSPITMEQLVALTFTYDSSITWQ